MAEIKKYPKKLVDKATKWLYESGTFKRRKIGSGFFFTEEKTDVLSIPLRAVRAEGEKKYVRVLTGDQLQEVGVKTGLKGDNGMVEIVEGLAANQVVVLRVIEEKK